MTQTRIAAGRRHWRLVLWIAVALSGAGLGVLAWRSSSVPISTLITPPRSAIGGPFVLTDEDGARFSSQRLAGKPFAIFFGFTQCPDVCPTTMLEMASVMSDLGDAAKDFRVYFVSVDPERDTPDILKAYTDSFDPRIVGLTGTPEEIAAVAAAYRAFYRKVPVENGYTLDHTAIVYLMDGEGRLASTIAYAEPHDSAIDKLRRLLAGR